MDEDDGFGFQVFAPIFLRYESSTGSYKLMDKLLPEFNSPARHEGIIYR
jgi:hypothetical protein